MSSLPVSFDTIDDYNNYIVYGPNWQVERSDPRRIFINVGINGKLVYMKFDTGADHSSISKEVADGIGLSKLRPYTSQLTQGLSGPPISMPDYHVNMTIQGKTFPANVKVGGGVNLLSWVDVAKQFSMTITPVGTLRLNPKTMV
jgi:hypothetical protein